MQRKILVSTFHDSVDSFSWSKKSVTKSVKTGVAEIFYGTAPYQHSKYDPSQDKFGVYIDIKPAHGRKRSIAFKSGDLEIKVNKYLVQEGYDAYFVMQEIIIKRSSGYTDNRRLEYFAAKDDLQSCLFKSPVMKMCDYLKEHNSHKTKITDPQVIKNMEDQAAALKAKLAEEAAYRQSHPPVEACGGAFD